VAVFVCALASIATAQQNAAVMAIAASNPVPGLIAYSGILHDASGQGSTGVTGVTFLLYREQQGGAPLWMETQNVAPDRAGRYSVQLGATTSNGIPANVFQTGEARWLAVQIAGEAEQTRVMLVAVPYAMKAADADTVGGLPASAFVLAVPTISSNLGSDGASLVSASAVPPTLSDVTTTGGTVNSIPLFTTAKNIQSSAIAQTGTGATAKIGIGTTAPAATLDIHGSTAVRGTLMLPATGVATASAGKPSEPINITASSFNSGTSAAVGQTFQLKAEQANNNTAAPGATLNLLYASGTATPAETGLRIGPKGIIAFAPGQTFPGGGGGGGGTITGVTAGIGLTGGGTTGTVTLKVDTTKVPLLALANTFAGSLSVNVSNTGAIGPTLTLTNPGGDNTSTFADGAAAIDFNTTAISNSGAYNPGARIEAVDDGVHSTDINFLSNIYGGGSGTANNGLQTNMTIFGLSGTVSIGTTEAQAQLEVIGTNEEGVWAFGGTEADFGSFQGLNGLRAGGGPSDGTDTGGIGAWLFGGDVDDGGTGTTGEGLLVWTGETESGTVGLAADFEGDVFVDGTLSANAKNFKIDHPLDPANKYLVHASVESSEMMNIYSGNVTTDDLGLATVALPDWFQAENTDFRYQLTVVDERFVQAVVSKPIQNNQFTIHTNASSVQVSWQITAVRQDAYAKAHPMVVEPVKGAKERGFYQHPELYGQPRNKQTQWGLNPTMVQGMLAEKSRLNQNALNKAKKIRDNPQMRPSAAPVNQAQLN
jgi:hypothetical protein